MRVHIGADAKAEDAGAAFIRVLQAGDNLFLIGRADGRPAVGQKDHNERPIARSRRSEVAPALPAVSGPASPVF